MWDYVLFFTCNLLVFLFALLIWHLFPKPPPFDYTTIPGLKPEPGQESKGNLPDIAENKRFSRFLTTLSVDFGSLSSFYWASTYVVCLSSWDLWNQLKKEKQFKSSALPFPAFYALKNSSNFKISIKNHIKEKIRDKPIDDENLSWKISFNYIFDVNLIDGKLADAASSMNKIIENHDEMLKNGPESDDEILRQTVRELSNLFRYKVENVENFVAQCFLCSAVKKCVFLCLTDNAKGIEIDAENPSPKLKSYVLETIRKAIPFEFLCYSFTKEIDLNGHPIPAGYPIIINVRDLFTDFKTFEKCQNFDTSRFGQDRSKKMNQVAEIIGSLPFYYELFNIVVETMKIST
jgi:hypothetical protein